MRLTDLEPRWVGDFDAPPDAKQGVGFLCPHCKTTRLVVFFANPICSNPPTDPADLRRSLHGHLADHHIGRIAWQRSGNTFETLSLLPSIDASAFGHWHGWITNGEVR